MIRQYHLFGMLLSILEKELNETFALLRCDGYEPELCRESVPYYESLAMCGEPDYMYGSIAAESVTIPKSLMGSRPVFAITVKGDSMKDAGIMPGDMAYVEMREDVNDGDIVLACIDNDLCTIKTFFCDDNGQRWLLPRNRDYKPILLKEGMNARIMGKVVSIKRETARASFRECMRILKDAREERSEVRVITHEKAVAAIRKIAGEITVGRMWYAAYRVFVDKKVIRENDYEGFLTLVEEAVAEHPNIPKAVELSRMCTDSFRKPLALWESENAPVTGKRFKDYLRIGRLTQEALME